MSNSVDKAVWTRVVSRNGYTEISNQLAEGDPFHMLAMQAKQAPSGPAEVVMGMGNGGEFGQVKVYVQIRIPVYPHEAAINLASEAAFVKLHQLVNEASAALGLNPLP